MLGGVCASDQGNGECLLICHGVLIFLRVVIFILVLSWDEPVTGGKTVTLPGNFDCPRLQGIAVQCW